MAGVDLFCGHVSPSGAHRCVKAPGHVGNHQGPTTAIWPHRSAEGQALPEPMPPRMPDSCGRCGYAPGRHNPDCRRGWAPSGVDELRANLDQVGHAWVLLKRCVRPDAEPLEALLERLRDGSWLAALRSPGHAYWTAQGGPSPEQASLQVYEFFSRLLPPPLDWLEKEGVVELLEEFSATLRTAHQRAGGRWGEAA